MEKNTFKNWNEWKDDCCFDGEVRELAERDMEILYTAMNKAINKITDKIMATYGKTHGIKGDEGREETRKSVQYKVRDVVDKWLYDE